MNPLAWMARYGLVPPHIVYDPTVEPQGVEVYAHRHDGTMLFAIEGMWRLLSPLLGGVAYPKAVPPEDWSRVRVIRYIVGDVTITSQYSDCTELPCGIYPGIREKYRLPLRCEYLTEHDPTLPDMTGYAEKVEAAVKKSYGWPWDEHAAQPDGAYVLHHAFVHPDSEQPDVLPGPDKL